MNSSYSETQLWKEFIHGDQDAFASIYKLYNKSLYRYGLYIAKEEDVEDALHDLYVKLYKSRNQLSEDIKCVKSYLIISLKNILLKKYNDKKSDLLINDVRQEEILFTSGTTIEDTIIKREQSEIDSKLLTELQSYLTEREQEAVFYRFVHQLSYKEVAEKMDLQEQSAKNLVHVALKKMRTHVPLVILFKLWLNISI